MCPSYQVTREEEHSTRGRARLLFEMLDGHGDGPITDGWRSDGGPRRPRPVPGLQGLQDRLPGQRRHGHLQGRVPRPPLPAPAAPARRLRHRLAAAAAPRRRPAGAAGAVNAAAPSRRLRRRGARGVAGLEDRDRCPRSPGRPCSSGGAPRPAAAAAHRPTRGHGAAVAGHVHQLLPPRSRPGRRRGARGRRLGGRDARPSRCAAG